MKVAVLKNPYAFAYVVSDVPEDYRSRLFNNEGWIMGGLWGLFIHANIGLAFINATDVLVRPATASPDAVSREAVPLPAPYAGND